MIALCLANKLMYVLDGIDEFMSGRNIIDNIRLILEHSDHSDLIL